MRFPNNKEKKKFLANDISERIIRVEQRVSEKFGKPVSYDDTEYYKSMNDSQKDDFEKYLVRKRKRKGKVAAVFLGFFLLFSLVNVEFTGNVVNENLGESGVNFIFLGGAAFAIAMFLLLSRIRGKRIRRVEELLYPIERVL